MKKISIVLLAVVFQLSFAAMAQAHEVRIEKKSSSREIQHDLVNLGANILHYVINDQGHTVVCIRSGSPGHRRNHPQERICRHQQHRREICQICRR